MKTQNYKDGRPAEFFDAYHERVRDREPGFVYDLTRMVTTPVSLFFYRIRPIEIDNVPPSGPVILAANHFSNMDHFLSGTWLRRKIHFFAKSQLFGNWLGDRIFPNGGTFPVRRGHRDEEAFKTLHAVLDRGGTVMIYAEGGRSRSAELGAPRPGVGRAALESGAPVVPMAIHGSQGARHWWRFNFPGVTIRYGKPISFDRVAEPSRDQQEECAEEIFAQIRAMYVELETEGRASILKRLPAGGPADSYS